MEVGGGRDKWCWALFGILLKDMSITVQNVLLNPAPETHNFVNQCHSNKFNKMGGGGNH